MPLQLGIPLEKEFVLERTDESFENDGTPTTIVVRQARQGEHERRAALFAKIVRETSSDEEDIIRLVQRFSFEELKRLECFLSLKACNIERPDGSPLWDFDKKGNIRESAFNEGWRQLPTFVAEEIHECVLQINVGWAPDVGEGF